MSEEREPRGQRIRPEGLSELGGHPGWGGLQGFEKDRAGACADGLCGNLDKTRWRLGQGADSAGADVFGRWSPQTPGVCERRGPQEESRGQGCAPARGGGGGQRSQRRGRVWGGFWAKLEAPARRSGGGEPALGDVCGSSGTSGWRGWNGGCQYGRQTSFAKTQHGVGPQGAGGGQLGQKKGLGLSNRGCWGGEEHQARVLRRSNQQAGVGITLLRKCSRLGGAPR